MLYLIKGEAMPNVPAQPEQVVVMLENMMLPSLKALAGMEREKKLVGGTMAGRRAFAIILEAPSNEEVEKWLQSLPFWGIVDWRVTPLVSFQTRLDSVTSMVQRVKALLKK